MFNSFTVFLCVDVKSVNKATMSNDLVLDIDAYKVM